MSREVPLKNPDKRILVTYRCPDAHISIVERTESRRFFGSIAYEDFCMTCNKPAKRISLEYLEVK